MTTDGQRKLFAAILFVLGLALYAAVKFAPLPHVSTSTSLVLIALAFGLWFAAARVMPDRRRDADAHGHFARWVDGRTLLFFGLALLLFGFGLWAMI